VPSPNYVEILPRARIFDNGKLCLRCANDDDMQDTSAAKTDSLPHIIVDLTQKAR